MPEHGEPGHVCDWDVIPVTAHQVNDLETQLDRITEIMTEGPYVVVGVSDAPLPEGMQGEGVRLKISSGNGPSSTQEIMEFLLGALSLLHAQQSQEQR